MSPFCVAAGDVCPGVQSQSGFPHLGTSSPAGTGFLRFTSGAKSADLLAASMVVGPFSINNFFWSPYFTLKSLLSLHKPSGLWQSCSMSLIMSL